MRVEDGIVCCLETMPRLCRLCQDYALCGIVSPGDYAKGESNLVRLTTFYHAFQSVEFRTLPRLVGVNQFEATIDSPDLRSKQLT